MSYDSRRLTLARDHRDFFQSPMHFRFYMRSNTWRDMILLAISVLETNRCYVLHDALPRYRRFFVSDMNTQFWRLNLIKYLWYIRCPLSIVHCSLYDLSIIIVHYSIAIYFIVSIYQIYAFISSLSIANDSSLPDQTLRMRLILLSYISTEKDFVKFLNMSSRNDQFGCIIMRLW